jgi:hypothetical protein
MVRRLILYVAGWAGVTLLHALVFTGTAAACGDWLDLHNHRMTASVNDRKEPKAQVPAPAPCHGPMCQEGPERAIPPASVVISPRVDRVALAAITVSDSPTPPRLGMVAERRVRPAKGFSRRLDHPPRV